MADRVGFELRNLLDDTKLQLASHPLFLIWSFRSANGDENLLAASNP
jgi:hypothetical protein